MKNEYIIINSNNEWLATESTLKEAIKRFSEIKRQLIEEQDDTEIYLYKAKEIKRFQFS